MFRDLLIIHLLEHKMAVSGNALLRQIYNGAVTAVCIISLGKFKCSVFYLFPETG